METSGAPGAALSAEPGRGGWIARATAPHCAAGVNAPAAASGGPASGPTWAAMRPRSDVPGGALVVFAMVTVLRAGSRRPLRGHRAGGAREFV